MREHRADGRAASAEVTKAIVNREIPPAKHCVCVDCGKPARDYDHRDYLRPLAVAPTCKPCNLARGCAFDSKYRPAGEVERPSFTKTDRRGMRFSSRS
jgi:hypothetical protein